MNECKPVLDYNPKDVKHTVNRWIVSELALLSEKCATAFDAFKFNEAANLLYQFAWGTFCDWYIEITKPLLQGDDQRPKPKHAPQPPMSSIS